MAKRPNRQHWGDGTGDRPRVLIECPPDQSPSLVASLVERHGYEVRTCEGPGAVTCDLLARGACGLVDGADAVVNLLGPGRAGRAVCDGVARLRRPPAVVVESRDASCVPVGATAVRSPATRRTLIAALDGALGR